MKKVCVTGAAGFIGGHLCRYLKDRGYWVRAVDYTHPRYGDVPCDEALWDCDLRALTNASKALVGVEQVFALAADMGGAGFVFTGMNDFEILCNNALINVNTAREAAYYGVQKLLFTSSACVYPEWLQTPDGTWMKQDGTPAMEGPTYAVFGLSESQAWNGKPDSAYGVEKLFSEELYHALGAWGLEHVRIARFHNIFGPRGSWNDGREKAPAALCRKVAIAKLTGNPEVEIWGDGEQVRSFCYIDDCLEMLYRLMQSDYNKPLNIGTDRGVTINKLMDIVADAAGIEVVKKYIEGPQGVRKRNADLSEMHQWLKYEPQVSLEEGIARTYKWIDDQVRIMSSSTS
jgi:GDP-D-mannose 3',5'-epimerase